MYANRAWLQLHSVVQSEVFSWVNASFTYIIYQIQQPFRMQNVGEWYFGTLEGSLQNLEESPIRMPDKFNTSVSDKEYIFVYAVYQQQLLLFHSLSRFSPSILIQLAANETDGLR